MQCQNFVSPCIQGKSLHQQCQTACDFSYLDLSPSSQEVQSHIVILHVWMFESTGSLVTQARYYSTHQFKQISFF